MSRGEQWAGVTRFWREEWSRTHTRLLLRAAVGTAWASRARCAARRELRRRHVNYEVWT